ncbi:hypothetical protein STAFG_3978 [Streptomyces afghaniensis 772]|uniref:Uncharacterized protein n=1 Tax=Streptomyces afghaniensis 772 TaxID=1283301 RepID=S4MHG9_9ACTN|nr:hypothetical protein STAFG_3978 [Streptomyces afghaniensis 772]
MLHIRRRPLPVGRGSHPIRQWPPRQICCRPPPL